METNENLNLDDKEEATSSEVHFKTCKLDSCRKEYNPGNRRSAFCSEKCRIIYKSKLSGLNGITESKPDLTAPKNLSLPKPKITGLEPAVQMAVDLLVKNAEVWEKYYHEVVARLKAVEEENTRLKEKIKEDEHAAALSGVEDAKPTLLGKILNEIPDAWKEHLGPAIGALASKAAQSFAGTDGQLDEPSQQMIEWVKSLPDEEQQKFAAIVATLMQMDSTSLQDTTTRIINLLTGGSAMKQETAKANPNTGQMMMGLG